MSLFSVGREHELEELQFCLKSALSGRGTTVFVSGEAGSGKTKLVTDFLNSAKEKEAITTLTGWCLSDAGIPYFPFIEAFSTYYSGLNKAEEKPIDNRGFGSEELEVNTWLKGPVRMGLSGPIEISPATWKDLTFAAVRKALASISTNRPIILFLDDIQWADSASLALLQYISRIIKNEKVLVIATFRSEDLKADIEGHAHPLSDALRLMGRDTLFKEVKLSRLSQTDVGLLAEHMVGGAIQHSLAQKLENESQGNPLFIVESLRMLSEKNCLVVNKDKWCLSTDEVGMPSKIKDIILHRVSRLKANQKKILEIASVIGSKFDPELLASVLGMNSIEVIETLDSISQASSLVTCKGNHYSFDHVKSRDAIYEEVSPALRKAYHGKIAERLEAVLDSKQVSDLAYHFAKAENKPKAIKYALAAGEEALVFMLGTEAYKHFQYVLDVTANDASFASERTCAAEGLGDSLCINANSRGPHVLEQLSKEADSNVVKVRALRKAARASLIEGNYGHALELAKKSISLPDDKLECARFRQVKGMVEAWGGYTTEALQDLEFAQRVFEEEYSLLDVIDADIELSLAYIMERLPENPAVLGQPEKSLGAILRALAISEYTQNLNKQVYANIIMYMVYNKCALTGEAEKSAQATANVVLKIGDPQSRNSNEAWSHWMTSFTIENKAMDKIFSKLPLEIMQNFGRGAKLKFYMSGLMSGVLLEFKRDLKSAIEHGLKGTEFAEEGDFYEIQALHYSNLLRQYSELGQLKQADIYYEKMEKIFNETSLAGFVFANFSHLLSKGVYFSAKHEWQKANESFEQAIAYYKTVSPSTGLEAGARQGYCWALLQQGRFEDAKSQYETAKKILNELEKRLVHTNILGYFIAPTNVEVGKKFDIRIDMVNAAKNVGTLVEIKDLMPTHFKIIATQPVVSLKEGSITLGNKKIKPFQDEAIMFTVVTSQVGVFTLQPQIRYIDDLGESKTCNAKPVMITVEAATPGKNSIPPCDISKDLQSEGDAEIDILKRFGLSR